MNYLNLHNVSLSFELKNYSSTLRAAITNTVLRNNKNKPSSIEVIKSISLKLQEGDSLGILGRNGSGKSTFLRLCSGIYPPNKGQVEINGNVTSLLSFGCGLRQDLLGIENIKLIYALNWILIPTKKKIDWIIKFSGLGDAIYQPVYTYSSGMIARLAFSIAVCEDPEILILDEVMGAGDKEFIKKARKRIEYLFEKSGIVLFASHDLNLIKNYCNRYIILEKGKIIEQGNTENLKI